MSRLAPLIGRWQTSGTVHGAAGAVSASIDGTDVYRWLPGGWWIAHEVDVVIGAEHVLTHELIGGVDAATGGWQMHAFDAGDSPSLTALVPQPDGRLLRRADGVRSWFDPHAGADLMTTRWEREASPGNWALWMDMRFRRAA
ncbi:hypothetical protein DQ239_09325 [Blastococcus sp. TF02-09]|uniref:hypothetical protein n=1 Tax=Blastococcus sp. TF02-09 TaxID=2250576 RepID=UPI000DE9BAF0|nr:hypothetical protein [Blastococcus sp. TF02-9]RBY77911.1 hypothetical protein DQ239_09325 [Blastococcus sp. TF02-9]